MLGRFISNGHLPYFNWTYPTNTSNDFSMKSGSLVSTELYEVMNSTL